jgi:hypothetical protein
MIDFLKNVAYLLVLAAVLWGLDRGASLGWFDKTRTTIGDTRLTYSKSNWKKFYRWVAVAVFLLAAWLLFK